MAAALQSTLDGLYDGRLFRPYVGAATPTMSSLAPIWPMELIPPEDSRARSTARTFRRLAGFLTASGAARSIWPAAILARILADQRRGADALDVLRRCLPAMNVHGCVAELLDDDGRWNLQYFATAHGALCSAIHGLLLRQDGEFIRPFPALPPGWRDAAFERLLVDGLEVSATLEDGRLTRVELGNPGDDDQTRVVQIRRRAWKITLRPGERRALRPASRDSS